MTIENTVSSDFWSALGDCIDCRLSGVTLLTLLLSGSWGYWVWVHTYWAVLCLLCNFAYFLSSAGLLIYFKINFSKTFFQEYHQSVRKFGSKSGLFFFSFLFFFFFFFLGGGVYFTPESLWTRQQLLSFRGAQFTWPRFLLGKLGKPEPCTHTFATLMRKMTVEIISWSISTPW